MRSDWELAKIAVMVYGLYNKFTQYPVLNKAIKDIPDDALLVAHTSRDRVWGDGGDGGTGNIGTNYLGKILTALSFVLKHGGCTTMSKELKNKLRISLGSPGEIVQEDPQTVFSLKTVPS